VLYPIPGGKLFLRVCRCDVAVCFSPCVPSNPVRIRFIPPVGASAAPFGSGLCRRD
jgi:hypothetical protein